MQISYRLQQAHLDAERKRNTEDELEGARERQEDLKRRVVSFRACFGDSRLIPRW